MTLWAVACQAPLSMGLSEQEFWSGLPCPSPGEDPCFLFSEMTSDLTPSEFQLNVQPPPGHSLSRPCLSHFHTGDSLGPAIPWVHEDTIHLCNPSITLLPS